MSPLYFNNGKLLIVNGKLATNSNCCCGGGCPPGSTCCGYYQYKVDYCEQVGGEWVQAVGSPNPGDPCECCNGFESSVLFEGDLGFGLIRILECYRYWCGEEVSGIPDYCCGSNVTQEQSDFCSLWWLRLSGQSPSDLVDPDAVCASSYFADVIQIGCFENPLP
jgi:hypothetical protein